MRALRVVRHQVEGLANGGQRPEAEQVDLEEAQGLDVVLVPLDHGAVLHRRRLDGHQLVDRQVTEEEAARVDGEMAGRVQQLVGEPGQVLVDRPLRIEPRLLEEIIGELATPVGREARERVEVRLIDPQGLADLAHRRAGPVADDVGDHRRVPSPVAVVDVLDDLFAAVVLDVEIDVRRLGPLAGEEALEEQAHAHRVDGGDPQAVADRAVGRAPAPLTEDPLAAAVLDDLVHRQEVAAVVEVLDHRELALELGQHVAGDRAAVAPLGSLEGQLREPALRRLPGGEGLGRVAVAQIPETEAALVGIALHRGEERRCVRVLAAEGVEGRQRVSIVRPKNRARLVERDPGGDAGHHVLQRAARPVVVEHLRRREETSPHPLRREPKLALAGPVGRPPVSMHHAVEAVAEGLPERLEQRRIRRGRHQIASALGHLGGGHPSLPLRLTGVTEREQTAEVGVALAPPGVDQEAVGRRRLAGAHGDLGAGDQRQLVPLGASLLHADVRSHESVDPMAIGEPEAGPAEGDRAVHQLLGTGGPMEEAVVALHPEERAHRSAHPCL